MVVFIKRLIMNLLYLFSYFSIRSKKIWVFGSYGNFNDNSRYLFLSMIEKKEVKSIWIAKNYQELKEVRKISRNCYYRYSLRGLFYCLRAKVYIYSAYTSDINYFTAGNVIRINLWHGIPLKKIEFDISKGSIAHIFNSSLISKFFHPWVYIRPSFLLSPSQYVTNYSFMRAFRVSEEQVIINTYPRVINLIEKQKKYVKSGDKFIFFYAPTWRDSNPEFLTDEFINLEVLNKFCSENNAEFLIKLHSNSKFKIDSSKYQYIKVLENSIDSNHAMIISDCLITDYSSIYFDYLFLEKPIILYRFDESEYIENSRELYEEMYAHVPGFIVKEFSVLLLSMSNIMNDKTECLCLSNELRVKLQVKQTQNQYCLIKEIQQKIG